MQVDGISVTLDLEGLHVVGVSVLDEMVELVIESQMEAGLCPECGQASIEPKERPQLLIRDLPISGRPTMLRWIKRRWKCTACGRTWTETHSQIPARARMTVRYKTHLANRAKAEGNFSQVAHAEGVSYDTVSRSFHNRVRLLREQLPPPSPKLLCIDEASFKKGHDYNTVISDGIERFVIETVRGRDGIGLAAWIASLDEEITQRIEAVAMDMWIPYHTVVSMMLPEAVRVADKFHVIRHANRALDGVRRRLSGRGYKSPSGFPRKLYDARFALVKAAERLTVKEEAKLSFVFFHFPEVKRAWELKEDLRDIYLTCGPDDAANALRYWFRRVEVSKIPEFRRLSRLFRKWENEILGYFDHRITNALAEGITNKVKVVKRQAYGLRNFDNFSDRILVQCGMPKQWRIPA